ncbi:hypothetical protein [Streptomyces sp. NPDC056144]|uniref:hypothetical protein n=1 Tax=unclassified Streptomyces TaxID=2593676 RepID=UPI0035E11FF9
MAYDVPLITDRGDAVPWPHLIAALRHVLADPPAPDRADPLGIPLADARRPVLDAVPPFALGDALHAAASLLLPPTAPEEAGHLTLDGFLLRDRATARLYVTAPEVDGRLGLDVSLRDTDGRVRVGNTALAAALPSLVPDELDVNRSPAHDPYAPGGVHDFTHW